MFFLIIKIRENQNKWEKIEFFLGNMILCKTKKDI